MAEASGSNGKHPICGGTRRNGQSCMAPALVDGSWCFAHHPGRAAERTAARRKGGEGRATAARLGKLMPARLRPAYALLDTALADVLGGSLDPRQATAAAAVARAMVAVVSAGEFEERLRWLEEQRKADA